METSSVPLELIIRRVILVRGEKVLMDSDLAELYGIPTKQFNQQVKRNLHRFPPDFMFRLVGHEFEALRSQIVTLKTGRGQHRKYLPLVFTEHGAIMAASVLNSATAIEVSVHVVRAFVQLRELVTTNRELLLRLGSLEDKVDCLKREHRSLQGETAEQFRHVFEALRELLEPKAPIKKRPIGFVISET